MKTINLSRQTSENECGLCCISMLASYYGYQRNISYYRNKYNVGRDGISFYDICIILKDIGFTIHPYEVKDLLLFQTNNKPYIVHLKNNHYVIVIFGKKHIQVFDPSGAKYKSTIEDFNKNFSGFILSVDVSNNLQKVHEKDNEFRHFNKVIKKSKSLLFFVIFTSILSYLVSIVVPLVLQQTINAVLADDTPDMINILLFISVTVAIFGCIAYIRNKGIIKLQVNLYEKISFSTIRHLFNIKYSFFDNRSQGNILYRISLLSQIQSAISTDLLNVILASSSIIIILCYFLIVYSEIFMYVLLLLVVITMGTLYFNSKILIQKRKELSSKEKVESVINEIVNNMFQIKCLRLGDYFFSSYSSKFFGFEKEFKKSLEKLQGLNLIVNMIFNYLPIYCLLFIIIMNNNAQYSVGELFAIYSFLGTLFTQCYALSSEISTFYLLKASLFYLNDLLDEDDIQLSIKQRYVDSLESIIFKNIAFRYNDFSAFTLEDVTLTVEKGDRIAIVGKSGSGKTTLIKLLAGLYKPSSGSILLNNIEYDEIDEKVYEDIISIVPQSSVFFNKSIRDNITLENPDIEDKDVVLALKTANLWEEVTSMPMGLDTIVSGQGGNLSGGQIQRISIARALLKKPKLLILDEATSSLDIWNEKKIYENLKKLEITQIVISHHLNTVKDSNKIYVIDKGRIVENGNHIDLLCMKGVYYTLFKEQIEM